MAFPFDNEDLANFLRRTAGGVVELDPTVVEGQRKEEGIIDFPSDLERPGLIDQGLDNLQFRPGQTPEQVVDTPDEPVTTVDTSELINQEGIISVDKPSEGIISIDEDIPQFSPDNLPSTISDLPTDVKKRVQDKAIANIGGRTNQAVQSVERESEAITKLKEAEAEGARKEAELRTSFADEFAKTSEAIKKERMKRLDALKEEISKISAIDPDRFWNSRSLLQKGSLIFASAVGGLNAAFGDGTNRNFEAISRLIDRDISTQAKNRNLQLQKIGQQFGVHEAASQVEQSDLSSMKLEHAARLEGVIAATKAEALKYESPVLREQLFRSALELENQRDKLYAEHAQNLIARDLQEAQIHFNQKLANAKLGLERFKANIARLRLEAQRRAAEAQAKASAQKGKLLVSSSFNPNVNYGIIDKNRAQLTNFFEKKPAIDKAIKLAKDIRSHILQHGSYYAGVGSKWTTRMDWQALVLRKMIKDYAIQKVVAQQGSRPSDFDFKQALEVLAEPGLIVDQPEKIWEDEILQNARLGRQLFLQNQIGGNQRKEAADYYFKELFNYGKRPGAGNIRRETTINVEKYNNLESFQDPISQIDSDIGRLENAVIHMDQNPSRTLNPQELALAEQFHEIVKKQGGPEQEIRTRRLIERMKGITKKHQQTRKAQEEAVKAQPFGLTTAEERARRLGFGHKILPENIPGPNPRVDIVESEIESD